MKKRILSSLLLLVLIPTVSGAIFLLWKENFSILETSLLSVLKNFTEENAPEPPDLGIDSVVVRKVSNPTGDFGFYKYEATIIIHNYGGNLIDGRVLLHADVNQKNALVRNTDLGFTLMRGDSYIVRNFEFVFDGEYNGGEIPIDVELVDDTDYYPENNRYVVEVFEDEAKIESIKIDEILYDGTVVLDFDSTPFQIREHEFELMTADEAFYDENDLKYDELAVDGEVFGYYRFKNSLENIHGEFESYGVSELESHFVENDPEFVYVKATNPQNGNYAISNIVMLPSQDGVTRGEFAGTFVSEADIDAFDNGGAFFDDVSEDASYFSAVQALNNLGLLSTSSYSFHPDDEITRGEVLRIVMDYFDVDLTINGDAPHFMDMDEDNYLYPYVEGMYAEDGTTVFKEYFYPDEAATEHFIKYLIHEYSENN